MTMQSTTTDNDLLLAWVNELSGPPGDQHYIDPFDDSLQVSWDENDVPSVDR
jgi:hypothetical protein